MPEKKSTFLGLPPQFKFLIGNGILGRYGIFQFRAILVVYMTSPDFLKMSPDKGTFVFHMFTAVGYFLPFIGAFLADRFFGKFRVIMAVMAVYAIGHIVMGQWESVMGLYVALALIAMGGMNGGLDGAFNGDQLPKGKEHLLNKVYSLFYWINNWGSFTAAMVAPLIFKHYGPGVAFGIPAVLATLQIVVLYAGRRRYVMVPPSGINPYSAIFGVIRTAWKRRNERKPGTPFFDSALAEHPEEMVRGVRSLANLSKLYITVAVFYALFDQHSSTWILQAKEMDLVVPGFMLLGWHFPGFTMLPSQLPGLNPLMVMCLIPIFSGLMYPFFERRGIAVTALRKMAAGMVLTVLAFVCVTVVQHLLDRGIKVHAMWQFWQYLIITMAEVLVAVTGLEFTYTQTPNNMKATGMAFWLFWLFLGNLFTSLIAKFNETYHFFSGAYFFLFFTVLMVAVAITFILQIKNYPVQLFMEGDAEAQKGWKPVKE